MGNTSAPAVASSSLSDNCCEEPNEGTQAWAPRDGAWHHVATIRSGDRLLTFLDGVLSTNHSLDFDGTTLADETGDNDGTGAVDLAATTGP